LNIVDNDVAIGGGFRIHGAHYGKGSIGDGVMRAAIEGIEDLRRVKRMMFKAIILLHYP
jgi:hypothetical protein